MILCHNYSFTSFIVLFCGHTLGTTVYAGEDVTYIYSCCFLVMFLLYRNRDIREGSISLDSMELGYFCLETKCKRSRWCLSTNSDDDAEILHQKFITKFNYKNL